jgi:hypothetical protein
LDGKTVSERDVAHGRCKKTKNRIGRRPPEAAVRRAKAAKWRKRGSMLNECNCGPAHLRRARSSIRMRDVLVGSKNSCDQTGMREIVSQTRYQRSWHPTKFNPSRCDALLCAGLAFGGCQARLGKKFAIDTKKCGRADGNGEGIREWAVCAPANKSHPGRVAAGSRPSRRRAFFGFKNLRD